MLFEEHQLVPSNRRFGVPQARRHSEELVRPLRGWAVSRPQGLCTDRALGVALQPLLPRLKYVVNMIML